MQIASITLPPDILYVKTIEEEGVKQLYVPLPEDPLPSFNWVFVNQPITSGITGKSR